MTYWLDVFTPKSLEEFQKAGAEVSGFPERRWKAVQRIKRGDILLCYVRSQSRWVGALEVVSEAFRSETRIWEDDIYPCRVKVKPLVMLEPASSIPAKNMLPRLKLFANLPGSRGWGVQLRVSPRRLAEEDGILIMSELRRMHNGKERREEEFHVTHTRLVEMLCDIGKTLGFVTKREEETPDKAYRCDVTWRDFEGHSPLKVFEVELSRNIDHALSSLAHALDTWRPEQLYLILTDESDFDRVKKLTEPRLRGAFSRVSYRLRAYPWTEVKKLYDNFSVYKDFIKDLAER